MPSGNDGGLAMRLLGFAIVMILLAGFSWPAFGQVEVTFPDPNLEAVIRDAIGKPAGPIYDIDLAPLVVLSASHASIEDLTGLEYCNQLADLDLGWNQISDLSPLAGLANLTVLDLQDNQISDLSPLPGLADLTHLDLEDNQITDIGPLVANTGVGSSDLVDLIFNPLSCDSILVHIPLLEARGAYVV